MVLIALAWVDQYECLSLFQIAGWRGASKIIIYITDV